jgi:hypothetical protein
VIGPVEGEHVTGDVPGADRELALGVELGGDIAGAGHELVCQRLCAPALGIERFEPSCLVCFPRALAGFAFGWRHREDGHGQLADDFVTAPVT